MTRWRALILALATLLFAVSGVASAAPPPGEPAPCHLAVGMAAPEVGHPKPGPVQHDMLAMNCCLGCLPSLAAPIAAAAERPERMVFDLRQPRLSGRSLPPELGPPRAARSPDVSPPVRPAD